MKITKLTPPISEKEIMDEWLYCDRVYISIICCTYNQELYISDAINSFLAQKTKYKFEIIIHDDCSTDETNNILNSFKRKYPNILKIIKPEENLYSKYGVNAPGLNAISQSLGEYIALCEGDDFWIDAFKLEKQYTNMIKHDVYFSFHRAKKSNNQNINISFDYGEYKKELDIKKIFSTHGQFSPTCSYMIKKEIIDTLPNWFISAVIGDFFLEIYSMKDKNGLYLPDIMSVYRENAINSWTRNNSQVDKKIDIYKKIIDSLMLSKSDFDQEICLLLDEKISHLYFSITNLYLVQKKFDESKKYINLLKNTHNKFSMKYTIYGLFKNSPYFLIFLIKIRKIFRQLF